MEVCHFGLCGRLNLVIKNHQLTLVVDIWELSGAALRLAIDLGCHHERGSIQSHQKELDMELDMRRRLFWS
jgi:hypothetical protein